MVNNGKRAVAFLYVGLRDPFDELIRSQAFVSSFLEPRRSVFRLSEEEERKS